MNGSPALNNRSYNHKSPVTELLHTLSSPIRTALKGRTITPTTLPPSNESSSTSSWEDVAVKLGEALSSAIVFPLEIGGESSPCSKHKKEEFKSTENTERASRSFRSLPTLFPYPRFNEKTKIIIDAAALVRGLYAVNPDCDIPQDLRNQFWALKEVVIPDIKSRIMQIYSQLIQSKCYTVLVWIDEINLNKQNINFSNNIDFKTTNSEEIVVFFDYLITDLFPKKLWDSEFEAMIGVIHGSTTHLRGAPLPTLDRIIPWVFASKGFRLFALCDQYQLDQVEIFNLYSELTREERHHFMQQVVPQAEQKKEITGLQIQAALAHMTQFEEICLD